MKKVLITGAGTGFGHEVAMRLALKGFDVIAAVEIYAQIQTLKREAAARGVTLRVEKLDVTNEGDRKKALAWNIEILVNNAGVLEGGSVLDIPGSNMRHEFEVNVIGPLPVLIMSSTCATLSTWACVRRARRRKTCILSSTSLLKRSRQSFRSAAFTLKIGPALTPCTCSSVTETSTASIMTMSKERPGLRWLE